MKKKYFYSALGLCLLYSLSSCSLDELPDSRIIVDNSSKIKALLVNAYPQDNPGLIKELSSDNVTDNGSVYDSYRLPEQAFRFETITDDNDNDSPQIIWQESYHAVSVANQALKSIADLGNPKELMPQKAEALLCRAYSEFVLSGVFCMSYKPQTAATDLGIPYPEKPETTVFVDYSRGTMQELYEKIDRDIEQALPLVDDGAYLPSAIKYHFNKQAAYAFAARFNLFYMKYQKVVDYASKALGSDPVLRNFKPLLPLSRQDIANAYIDAAEPANLLLITHVSYQGRILQGGANTRYNHSTEIANTETFGAIGPWGGSGVLYYDQKLYGTDQVLVFPKTDERFEITDKTNRTGYPHIVETAFTTDETLLCRAEAYIQLKDYDMALADLNFWQSSHCAPSTGDQAVRPLTLKSLADFYNSTPYAEVVPRNTVGRSIKKKLSPQGFTVDPGDQENLTQCLLQMRRLETIFSGGRFDDIKRYGISFSHTKEYEAPIIFSPGDLRGAIQLPAIAINKKLKPNPRK